MKLEQLGLAKLAEKMHEKPQEPPNLRMAAFEVNKCASCKYFIHEQQACNKYKWPVSEFMVCDDYKPTDMQFNNQIDPSQGNMMPFISSFQGSSPMTPKMAMILARKQAFDVTCTTGGASNNLGATPPAPQQPTPDDSNTRGNHADLAYPVEAKDDELNDEDSLNKNLFKEAISPKLVADTLASGLNRKLPLDRLVGFAQTAKKWNSSIRNRGLAQLNKLEKAYQIPRNDISSGPVSRVKGDPYIQVRAATPDLQRNLSDIYGVNVPVNIKTNRNQSGSFYNFRRKNIVTEPSGPTIAHEYGHAATLSDKTLRRLHNIGTDRDSDIAERLANRAVRLRYDQLGKVLPMPSKDDWWKWQRLQQDLYRRHYLSNALQQVINAPKILASNTPNELVSNIYGLGSVGKTVLNWLPSKISNLLAGYEIRRAEKNLPMVQSVSTHNLTRSSFVPPTPPPVPFRELGRAVSKDLGPALYRKLQRMQASLENTPANAGGPPQAKQADFPSQNPYLNTSTSLKPLTPQSGGGGQAAQGPQVQMPQAQPLASSAAGQQQPQPQQSGFQPSVIAQLGQQGALPNSPTATRILGVQNMFNPAMAKQALSPELVTRAAAKRTQGLPPVPKQLQSHPEVQAIRASAPPAVLADHLEERHSDVPGAIAAANRIRQGDTGHLDDPRRSRKYQSWSYQPPVELDNPALDSLRHALIGRSFHRDALARQNQGDINAHIAIARNTGSPELEAIRVNNARPLTNDAQHQQNMAAIEADHQATMARIERRMPVTGRRWRELVQSPDYIPSYIKAVQNEHAQDKENTKMSSEIVWKRLAEGRNEDAKLPAKAVLTALTKVACPCPHANHNPMGPECAAYATKGKKMPKNPLPSKSNTGVAELAKKAAYYACNRWSGGLLTHGGHTKLGREGVLGAITKNGPLSANGLKTRVFDVLTPFFKAGTISAQVNSGTNMSAGNPPVGIGKPLAIKPPKPLRTPAASQQTTTATTPGVAGSGMGKLGMAFKQADVSPLAPQSATQASNKTSIPGYPGWYRNASGSIDRPKGMDFKTYQDTLRKINAENGINSNMNINGSGFSAMGGAGTAEGNSGIAPIPGSPGAIAQQRKRQQEWLDSMKAKNQGAAQPEAPKPAPVPVDKEKGISPEDFANQGGGAGNFNPADRQPVAEAPKPEAPTEDSPVGAGGAGPAENAAAATKVPQPATPKPAGPQPAAAGQQAEGKPAQPQQQLARAGGQPPVQNPNGAALPNLGMNANVQVGRQIGNLAGGGQTPAAQSQGPADTARSSTTSTAIGGATRGEAKPSFSAYMRGVRANTPIRLETDPNHPNFVSEQAYRNAVEQQGIRDGVFSPPPGASKSRMSWNEMKNRMATNTVSATPEGSARASGPQPNYYGAKPSPVASGARSTGPVQAEVPNYVRQGLNAPKPMQAQAPAPPPAQAKPAGGPKPGGGLNIGAAPAPNKGATGSRSSLA